MNEHTLKEWGKVYPQLVTRVRSAAEYLGTTIVGLARLSDRELMCIPNFGGQTLKALRLMVSGSLPPSRLVQKLSTQESAIYAANCWQAGFSLKEIGDVLGISSARICTHISDFIFAMLPNAERSQTWKEDSRLLAAYGEERKVLARQAIEIWLKRGGTIPELDAPKEQENLEEIDWW